MASKPFSAAAAGAAGLAAACCSRLAAAPAAAIPTPGRAGTARRAACGGALNQEATVRRRQAGPACRRRGPPRGALAQMGATSKNSDSTTRWMLLISVRQATHMLPRAAVPRLCVRVPMHLWLMPAGTGGLGGRCGLWPRWHGCIYAYTHIVDIILGAREGCHSSESECGCCTVGSRHFAHAQRPVQEEDLHR